MSAMLELVTARSPKSLEARQNETARRVVRELLLSQYQGNQVAMAAACRVSQSTISNVISGKSGLGPRMLMALIRVHPAEAMRAMGIEVADGGQPLGEHASQAIDALESDGYSSEVATWAVLTSVRFGASSGTASIVSVARAVARFGEAIEQLTGSRPSGSGSERRR